MPEDEDDESTSDGDSQTKYHIYHEHSTDTESIDSENSTFEVNDESIQPILSEIISAEPIEAFPQSVHFEDNITLRGDDDQPQPEPEEQLGRGHRDRRLPIKLDDYVHSNDSEDYGLLSYQQAISGEEKNEFISQLSASILETIKESFIEEIDLLKNENESLREQIINKLCSLVAKLEHCDRSFKKRNLIFHGIREAKNEISSELIRNLISEKLEVDVNQHKIERSYRIGKTDEKNATNNSDV
ncbi:hypothetical protein JTB14_029496 [Gonioctena quinquepunctata]|nr:hypothetical protein JTB14_029496 [Gonioctena quinquepunctata]